MTYTPGSSTSGPNPQGKGQVPVLRDWETLSPATVGAFSGPSFLRAYCISSLVLSARFRFKPVVGRAYYLYAADQEWLLSMIAPGEWHGEPPGDFLAPCRLQADMTWTLDATDLSHSPALDKLHNFVAAFVETVSSHRSIGDALPYFVSHLPYYQRLLATAMSASLGRSPVARADIGALIAPGDDVPGLIQPSPG